MCLCTCVQVCRVDVCAEDQTQVLGKSSTLFTAEASLQSHPLLERKKKLVFRAVLNTL